MELRKLQVTGGSTHVVSLPKRWIDRNRLQRSDQVTIHEEPDGSLLIAPFQDASPRTRATSIKLQPHSKRELVVRSLVGAYLAGADEIRLETEGHMGPDLRDIIRSVAKHLVGVEILEESSRHVVLQDLVGVSQMDLRKTVTRMHRIAAIMFDDALTAFADSDHELAADVTGRDDELDRLEWHISKQMHAFLDQPRLAARMSIRPTEALNLFLAARSLERLGDHASKISRNLRLLPADAITPEIHASIAQHGAALRMVWDDAFAALKANDFDRASGAVDAGKKLAAWRSEMSQLLQNVRVDCVVPLTLIADSLDRTRGYAIDIAETAMNQTFQKS